MASTTTLTMGRKVSELSAPSEIGLNNILLIHDGNGLKIITVKELLNFIISNIEITDNVLALKES